jgi:hypothetical protein
LLDRVDGSPTKGKIISIESSMPSYVVGRSRQLSAADSFHGTQCGQTNCESRASDAIVSDVRLCVEHWQAAIRDFNLAAETLAAHHAGRDEAITEAMPAGARRISGWCPSCRQSDVLWTSADGSEVQCGSDGCSYLRSAPQHADRWHEQLLEYSRGRPVVYYVRFGLYIKIGTSEKLRSRLLNVPHDELMAIEFGGPQLEARRHSQFSVSRHVGEWFLPSADLISHVERLRFDFEAYDVAA